MNGGVTRCHAAALVWAISSPSSDRVIGNTLDQPLRDGFAAIAHLIHTRQEAPTRHGELARIDHADHEQRGHEARADGERGVLADRSGVLGQQGIDAEFQLAPPNRENGPALQQDRRASAPAQEERGRLAVEERRPHRGAHLGRQRGERTVEVKMTLTAPGCGMGEILVDDVRSKLEMIPTIAEADVELVFDPPWGRHMMSEAARLGRTRGMKAAQQAGSVKTLFGRLKDWFLGNF